jgi:hypothetical protein
VNRAEIAEQLRQFLNGSLTAEDLSAWAKRKSLEVTSLGSQQERDEVDEILDRCILAEVAGLELSESEAISLLDRIVSAPN